MSAGLAFVGAVLGAGASIYGANKASAAGSRRRSAARTVFGQQQTRSLGLLPAIQQNEARRLQSLNQQTELTVDKRIQQDVRNQNAMGNLNFSNYNNSLLEASNVYSGLDLAYQQNIDKVFEQSQIERDAVERSYYQAASSAAQAGAVLGTDFEQAVQDTYGGTV